MSAKFRYVKILMLTEQKIHMIILFTELLKLRGKKLTEGNKLLLGHLPLLY